MTENDCCEIFKKHLKPLKATSLDNHSKDESACFMTESMILVVDFDGVKNEYISKLKLQGTPQSNDALFATDEGKRLTFIEFKNGTIDKDIPYKLKRKIYDSLLIFTDIIGKGISYTRDNMDYVLVYNEFKNAKVAKALEPDEVQSTNARDFIAKSITAHANKNKNANFIKYGLESFQGYCFKHVFTYTQDEFAKRFT